jgi:hypothetical protein
MWYVKYPSVQLQISSPRTEEDTELSDSLGFGWKELQRLGWWETFPAGSPKFSRTIARSHAEGRWARGTFQWLVGIILCHKAGSRSVALPPKCSWLVDGSWVETCRKLNLSGCLHLLWFKAGSTSSAWLVLGSRGMHRKNPRHRVGGGGQRRLTKIFWPPKNVGVQGILDILGQFWVTFTPG